MNQNPNPMEIDSLGNIGVFVRVAERLGFSAVARELGLSPSAVGKAIARLEERLGVRLFNRSTRALALTAEGERFLSAAAASCARSRRPSWSCATRASGPMAA